MNVSAVQGYGTLYALRIPADPPSAKPAEPVLVAKEERVVRVGGPGANEATARSSQRQQDFFGAGATSAESGRSAWEPVGNLEILEMREIFFEMRSVPGDQGPGFIQKYFDELNQLAVNR